MKVTFLWLPPWAVYCLSLLGIPLVVVSPTRLCLKLDNYQRFIRNPLQLTHHSVVFLPQDASQTDILIVSWNKTQTPCIVCMIKRLYCTRAVFFFPGVSRPAVENVLPSTYWVLATLARIRAAEA